MDDEQLIRSILQGNGNRFADLVERYQTKLFQTTYHYTQNVEDARDLTQEIFIKAYNSLASFRFGSSFATWLYRIGVNHCIDWTRKKKPQNLMELDFSHQDPSAKSPEEVFLHRQTVAEIQGAIRGLPEIYSTVLILYYFDDFNPQQIADILGTPKRTVETRLFRGKKLLREKLHGTMDGGESHDMSAQQGRVAQLR